MHAERMALARVRKLLREALLVSDGVKHRADGHTEHENYRCDYSLTQIPHGLRARSSQVGRGPKWQTKAKCEGDGSILSKGKR